MSWWRYWLLKKDLESFAILNLIKCTPLYLKLAKIDRNRFGKSDLYIKRNLESKQIRKLWNSKRNYLC